MLTNHQGNANQTTVRDHLEPVRMAIVKKKTNNNVGEDVERWNPSEQLVEM